MVSGLNVALHNCYEKKNHNVEFVSKYTKYLDEFLETLSF